MSPLIGRRRRPWPDRVEFNSSSGASAIALLRVGMVACVRIGHRKDEIDAPSPLAENVLRRIAEATPGAGAIDSGEGAALEAGVQTGAVQGHAGRAVFSPGVDRSAAEWIGPGLSRAVASPAGFEPAFWP
jgi:hypothetical protein